MSYEPICSPEVFSSLHKPKARWSPQEDQVLLQTVEASGPSNWNGIAAALPGRTGKQCRERWITKLSPAITANAWTPDEDATLVRLQIAHGNQWAKFRTELPHRSTVSIKNRWTSLRRRGQSGAAPVAVARAVPTGAPDCVAPSSEFEEQLVGFDDLAPFEEFPWFL
jgi:hypothetical protein